MDDEAVIRRRKLPHIDVAGKPTFITTCLEGSLPAAGLKRIREYRDKLNARALPDKMSLADWQTGRRRNISSCLNWSIRCSMVTAP